MESVSAGESLKCPVIPGEPAKPDHPIRRGHWIGLLCILIATASLRIYRLDTPKGYYFDEIYFGYTARQCLAGNRDIYNPHAKPPAGVSNEWSHPPLGKLISAAIMAIAGQDEFGMRLSSALMGCLAVLLVFLLTVALFESPQAGLLAAGLLSLEGLAFVQSRMATVDSHVVVFLLASLLFYVIWRKQPGRSMLWLAAAGLAAGMMLATKWTGVFLLFLLGADLLICGLFRLRPYSRKTVLAVVCCLVVLPVMVYLASYAQCFAMGYGWRQFWSLQRHMWRYHAHLQGHHAYQSVPWQWVLNVRPVWLYVRDGPGNTIANIYNLGNSVVLYFGVVAMATLAVRQFRRRSWAALFLLAGYLILWTPWAFSPRLMFFYHYLPAVPLLCVASGWLLARWQTNRRRWVRLAGWSVVALSAAWFIFFFPQMTAISVPQWWADAAYYWIPSWR